MIFNKLAFISAFAITSTSTAQECDLGTIVDVAVGNGSFNTLVAAVTAAELVETLSSDGPFTVFAPTDDAFAALPEGTVEGLLEDIPSLTSILTYHVVSGKVESGDLTNGPVPTVNGADVEINLDDGVKVNDSNVVIADVQACNGVIHVIDAVLMPPTPEAAPEPDEECDLGSIVDVAVGNGSFNTLVAAVTAADLAGTLSGDGPFTVFAPTDEAFAALPEGTVEGLLEDIPALTSILTYHVVAGKVESTDLVNGPVPTVNGADVEINLDDGVKVNDASVVIADVQACNGVIHVIDSVILPPTDMAETDEEMMKDEDDHEGHDHGEDDHSEDKDEGMMKDDAETEESDTMSSGAIINSLAAAFAIVTAAFMSF